MGYIGCDEYAIYVSIRYFVQPTYWELGYVQGDDYVLYVWFRYFVQPLRRRLGHVLVEFLPMCILLCNSVSGKVYVCLQWYWNAGITIFTQTAVV